MGFDYSLADGQAQAVPSHRTVLGLAGDSGELPEEVGQLLVGYAPARVRDGELDVDVLQRPGHPDHGPLGRVLGGVGEEVVQHLQHTLLVHPDPGQVRGRSTIT